MSKITAKQKEATAFLVSQKDTLPVTRNGGLMTGLNTNTIRGLVRAGLIKCRIYLNGIVTDLEITEKGYESATDVRVSNEGSIFLFALLTPAAREWVDEYVSEDRQTFGGQLVVEHRYARDLTQGMQEAGLIVR